ncbi:MAG: HEAT repeat domain-containing protein [Candidatus Riflebacteria bacterium]|nr:HEAT repeat domain-containing protein [Candidatus Riflebacteria bacterium]
MLNIGIKIVALTIVYFVGWFVIEKLYNYFALKLDKTSSKTSSIKKRKIVPLASVTPVDQTWRYIKGLKSPDWRVRRIACLQLGDRRGTAVVEALIEALNDPKEEVSLAAGESLAKIGDPLAIEALSNHCRELEESSERSYENYRAA